jgi:hypothetical protein
MNRQEIEDAIDKVMLGVQDRRARLGFPGLDEAAAALRDHAIQAMPTEAFQALLAVEDDEARERQIMALEAAQRRQHAVVRIGAEARSKFDDRLLFRWSCACGEEAPGDYFSAEDARNAWGRHAGWLAPEPPNKTCDECGKSHTGRGRYCSRACRERAQ